jgi:competence ComEA-like helix-hairpin-helix protein
MAVMDPSQCQAGAIAERSMGLGVAVCLCAAAAILLAVSALDRRTPARPSGQQEKVNPNTASASSLVRLPRIGWPKAQAVIVYREQRIAVNPAVPAFSSPEDMMRVPGFGRKTVDLIAPWLDFDPSRTAPTLSSSPLVADSR